MGAQCGAEAQGVHTEAGANGQLDATPVCGDSLAAEAPAAVKNEAQPDGPDAAPTVETPATFKDEAQPESPDVAPAVEIPAPVKEEAQPKLPDGTLIIEFLDGGESKQIGFTKKPLGMTFETHKAPLVVNKLVDGGHASELGVKLGWQFSKVGEVDLAGKDFTECMKHLQAGVAKLQAS